MSQLSRPLAENRSEYKMNVSSLLALLFASNQALIVQDVALAHANGDINDEEAVTMLKESKLSTLKDTSCPYLSELLGLDLVVYAVPTPSQLANVNPLGNDHSIATQEEIDIMEGYSTEMIEDNE